MESECVKEQKIDVVVVNDNLIQLALLSGLMRKAGFEPHAFTGAEAALEAMSHRPPPALIITDLYMPGVDGWRFCRLLRSFEYAPLNKVPILVVSATYSGEEPERIAADLGVDAFLSSPVDGRHFIDHVWAIIHGERKKVPLRVLVVEDTKSLAAIFEKALCSEGYKVDKAYTVYTALEALNTNSYDLALIDYHLPDGSGDTLLDMCCTIRPNCVCIMMTGDPKTALAVDWMKRGAAAYLKKPFALDYLIEICARARRERALMRVQNLLEERTCELRESEERYRLLFDGARDAMMIIEPQSCKYSACNPAAAKMFGFTDKPEFTALSPWDISHELQPDGQLSTDKALNMVEKALEEGYSYFDWMHCRLDGTEFPTNVLLTRVEMSGNISIIATVRDITTQKQAEADLLKSERRFKDLADLLPEALFEADKQMKLTFVNRKAISLFGYNAMEVAEGRFCLDMIVPEDRERAFENIKKRMTGVDEGPIEYRALRKDGSTFPVLVSSSAIIQNNEPVGLRELIFDVTERKREEEEKGKLQAQLNQAQKMEAIGTLAGGIAHDFNNILTSIIAFTELAAIKAKDEKLRHYLDNILKGCERATDLVRQILAFSRHKKQEQCAVDVKIITKEALKLLRSSIPATIEISHKFCDKPCLVNVDPTHIHQIIMNLSTNAVHAMREKGGVLDIDLSIMGIESTEELMPPGIIKRDYVKLSVVDTGHGIDPSIREKIFDPFFTTKPPGEGTGLGLAVVYGIVKSYEGHIELESQPGKGTKFSIYIPLLTEKNINSTKVSISDLKVGKERILLVDDEPEILVGIGELLHSLGYDVTVRTQGQDALELVRCEPENFDLVITDMTMPRMTGYDLAIEITKIRPNMPIILCTGYNSDVSEEKTRHIGICKLLKKPLRKENLAATVRKVLDSQ
jgi:PAS domain S-box-containing protein